MTKRILLLALAVCLGIVTGNANAVDRLPFTLPPGFVAERVAGPPLVERPMHACFDERGRLFVADSAGVNLRAPDLARDPPHRIVMLEDTDGDGKFDRSTVFADRLHFPQGVACQGGAVFTTSPPSLWRLEMGNQGTVGLRRELVTGFAFTGLADDLHGPTEGPDGWLYWSTGRFPYEIRVPGNPVLHKGRAGIILRCRPNGEDVEVYGGAHGNVVKIAFTDEGEPLGSGTFSHLEGRRNDGIIHCVEGGSYPLLGGIDFGSDHKRTGDNLSLLSSSGVSAAAGVTRYRSDAFGPGYRDNLFSALFNLNRVRRHILERTGSTFRARDEDFLVSDNRDFHPTDVVEDADGSLLVIDTGGWFRIACPTSQVAKPEVKGAIYRIRHEKAPRVTDPRGLSLKWSTLPASELVQLLDDPRFAVRDRAVRELAVLGPAVVPALKELLARSASVRARRNGVWALARMPALEARQATRLALADPDPSIRQTAVCATGLYRDTAALGRLRELVESDTPPIRRETATALGRLGKSEAVPSLLAPLRSGCDRFLEHALIWALIRIADREALQPALADPSPAVRRAALIALDQMKDGQLTREQVAPLLGSHDPALQRTALGVLTRRPGWARETLDLLRRWLDEKSLPAERHEMIGGIVSAFAADAGVQELVASYLRREATSAATRLLLLEAVGRTSLEKLPALWAAELRWALDHAEPRVVRQAIGCIRAGKVAEFDVALLRLAADPARPDDLRVEAVLAAAARLNQVEPALFQFLARCLEPDRSPLLRLAAASALGQARLSPDQLLVLAKLVSRAGAIETPRLLPAFENVKADATRMQVIGREFLASLDRSPGRQSLSADDLRRTLKNYPPEVLRTAAPMLKRLEPDIDQQKARLAALEPALKDGDSHRGRELFFGPRASCFACHAVQADGGRVGPDLSKIGAIRSGRDLLEAIVFPSASLARGFESYLIQTRDGRVVTGLIVRETVDAVHVLTAERTEVRIPRTAIETLEQGRVSIMPQGLDVALSRQELADLIAFLEALK